MASIMTPEYVAKEIVEGVLEEQEAIFLPHYTKYIIMVKENTPRWLSTWVAGITGDLKAMETFTGKQTKVDIQQTKTQSTKND